MSPWTDINPRAIKMRPIVIIGRWFVVRVHIYWRRRRRVRHFLVHVEIDALRNSILGRKSTTCSERPDLRKLIRGEWRCLNDVLKGTEVVKGAVGVAENLQVNRGVAEIIAIGVDASAR